MTLGERCDEIVRLIDETLGDIDSTEPDPRWNHPSWASMRPTLTLVPSPTASQDPDTAGKAVPATD
jgi:hypothetical protein